MIVAAAWRHRPVGVDELSVVTDDVGDGEPDSGLTRRTALLRRLNRNVLRRHRILPEVPMSRP